MITHDPYELRVGGVEMYVDLGAEQLIAAERDQIKIAIEVKSFIGASAISEFHNAHGQFLDYRFALEEEDPIESCIWPFRSKPTAPFSHCGSFKR